MDEVKARFLELLLVEVESDEAKNSWTAEQWIEWLMGSVQADGYRPITSRELLKWSMKNNRYKKLEDVASNKDHPLYSLCKVLMVAINRPDTTVDFNESDQVMMMSALLQANVFSQDDKIELESFGRYQKQRIFIHNLQELGIQQIQEVLDERNNA